MTDQGLQEHVYLIEPDNKTITQVQLTKAMDKSEPDLTSKYFQQHPKGPVINVYKLSKENEHKLRNCMGTMISENEKDIKLVSAYMWHYQGKISQMLDEDWIAMISWWGRRIPYLLPAI